jgi:hypothetical protein
VVIHGIYGEQEEYLKLWQGTKGTDEELYTKKYKYNIEINPLYKSQFVGYKKYIASIKILVFCSSLP